MINARFYHVNNFSIQARSETKYNTNANREFFDLNGSKRKPNSNLRYFLKTLIV